MRVIKFLILFALLLCLMEPCLVVARGGRTGCGAFIRFAVISFLNSHICAKGCFDIDIMFLASWSSLLKTLLNASLFKLLLNG